MWIDLAMMNFSSSYLVSVTGTGGGGKKSENTQPTTDGGTSKATVQARVNRPQTTQRRLRGGHNFSLFGSSIRHPSLMPPTSMTSFGISQPYLPNQKKTS